MSICWVQISVSDYFSCLLGCSEGCNDRSTLWMLHGLSNCVSAWDLPSSWISLWACCWIFFSSGSFPFPYLQFFQTATIYGSEYWLWDSNTSFTWCPVFLKEVGFFQVHFPHCRAFDIGSLLLSRESLSPPRSLVHSGGSPQPLTSWGCLFPFFLLAFRVSVISIHLIQDHVSLSPPVPFPLHVSPSTILVAFFILPCATEVSSLGPFSL